MLPKNQSTADYFQAHAGLEHSFFIVEDSEGSSRPRDLGSALGHPCLAPLKSLRALDGVGPREGPCVLLEAESLGVTLAG